VPYHDEGQKLLRTLESVRTEAHLVDVLVVDDGSTQSPAAEITSEAELGDFVETVTLPTNLGLTGALNRGLELLLERYEYVARLDTGDQAVDGRFAGQIDFLDANPSYGVVGCDALMVDANGNEVFTLRFPRTDKGIRHYMRINNPFTHSSVTMRSAAVRAAGDVYSEDYPAAEDYAAWWSLLAVSRGRNLPAIGVIYEIDPGSISSLRRRDQIRSRMRLMWRHFDRSPRAAYGLLRAGLLLLVPRTLSVRLNTIRRSRARRRPVTR
jgi:glycosyltransferase involved in cell wall biosynthesis